jgi:hypothetical protein
MSADDDFVAALLISMPIDERFRIMNAAVALGESLIATIDAELSK